MKIPLDWLKEYVTTTKTPQQIADVFTLIGLMLDKPLDSTGAVLDLEHRMDRADWLSVLGCARDFAAHQNTQLKFPQIHQKQGITPAQPLIDIKVTTPLVRRFNTKVTKKASKQSSQT